MSGGHIVGGDPVEVTLSEGASLLSRVREDHRRAS